MKKRKTWLWIIGWIIIFPLPLTILMLRSRKNSAFKSVIILAAWTVYLAMAMSSGGERNNTIEVSSSSIDKSIQKDAEKEQPEPTNKPAPIDVESIEIENIDNTSLIIGDKLEAKASVFPADAKDKAILWTSSDDTVATVNEEGLVTAVGGGDAVIKASSSNGVESSFAISVDGSRSRMNVHIRDTREDDVNIGSEWTQRAQINGEPPADEIILTEGEDLSLYMEKTEMDDVPDVGSESVTYTVSADDILHGFDVSFDLYVMENGGRNRGQSAHFIVTFSFSPIS